MFKNHFASTLCMLCVVLQGLLVKGGKVTVELTLVSYSNPSGRDWLNQRCDDRGFTAGECDTYFKLCLDEPGGADQAYTNSLDGCSFYTAESHRFAGHSPTFGTESVGFPNPLEYNITDWQGGFLVKVASYDDDRLTTDDVIDVLIYRYGGRPAKNQQEAGSGITEDVQGGGPGAQTSMKINLVVYCTEFYYYPIPGDPSDPCSLYCKSEDSSSGHYTCSETGQIICLPGWMNETSNCLVSTNRQTDTNTNTTNDITGPGLDTAQMTQSEDFFGTHRNLIIGLIAGLFLLLLIIVLLIALLLRNRRKRRQKDAATSAYINTAMVGQQTSTTTSNSAGTATNPLYLTKPNGTFLPESPYSEVDYSMVKLPVGGAHGQEAITPAMVKAREAGALPDSYYDKNLKYNPTNTQPSPYMDDRSRSKYALGGNERGTDIGMAEGVRGGFSPMGGDSTTYGMADNRFDNPTYEAPNLDVDVPGKVSVVKKMAGLYDEPIKYKM